MFQGGAKKDAPRPKLLFTTTRSLHLKTYSGQTLKHLVEYNLKVLKTCPYAFLVYGSSSVEDMSADGHHTKFSDIDIFTKTPFYIATYLTNHVMKASPLELYSVINAIHKTTLRYRANGRPLTDMSYMDRSIFNFMYKASTERFGNMGRFIHPFFQLAMLAKIPALPGQSYSSDHTFGFSDTTKFAKAMKQLKDTLVDPPPLPTLITDRLIEKTLPTLGKKSEFIPNGCVVSGVAALLLYEYIFDLNPHAKISVEVKEDGYVISAENSYPIAPIFMYTTDVPSTGRITYDTSFNDMLFNLEFEDPKTFIYRVNKLPPQFNFMSLNIGKKNVPVVAPIHLLVEFGCTMMFPMDHAKVRSLWMPIEVYYIRICKLLQVEMAGKIPYYSKASMYAGYVRCPPIPQYNGYEGEIFNQMLSQHNVMFNRETRIPDYMDPSKPTTKFAGIAHAYAKSWGITFKDPVKDYKLAHLINGETE